MSDFGELALVVGDFHIPHRAVKIPEKFQRMLVPNKMQRKIKKIKIKEDDDFPSSSNGLHIHH
jgi:hypothetical protein